MNKIVRITGVYGSLWLTVCSVVRGSTISSDKWDLDSYYVGLNCIPPNFLFWSPNSGISECDLEEWLKIKSFNINYVIIVDPWSDLTGVHIRRRSWDTRTHSSDASAHEMKLVRHMQERRIRWKFCVNSLILTFIFWNSKQCFIAGRTYELWTQIFSRWDFQ